MKKIHYHWADTLTWVKKVIDSCETQPQIKNAYKLISLYEKQLYQEMYHDLNLYTNISRELYLHWQDKQDKIFFGHRHNENG